MGSALINLENKKPNIADRRFNMERKETGTGKRPGIGIHVKEDAIKGEGSLAKKITPNQLKGMGSTGAIDVRQWYPWTLSPIDARIEVPYVRLTEFNCNEDQIKRQAAFYTALGTTGGKQAEVLDVYKEVFSHLNPTNFSYWFPYFNDTNFELSTPNWEKLDGAGEQLKGLASDATGFLFGKDAGAYTKKALDFMQGAGETVMKGMYPTVGILDRPRIFKSHDERQITISFPLYNTLNVDDWSKNYELISLLMSQNLFNKRDYITGVPPVFYDVYIPGQYYCWASAMTNINVKNLGNVRLVDNKFVVPDAYQVSLTLSEMIMPSKNQFEALTSGAAAKFVDSSVVRTETKNESLFTNLRQTLGLEYEAKSP